MNIDMDKYTKFVMGIANKVPFLFPKAFSVNAKYYHSGSDYTREKKEEQPRVYYVSLFESPFNWKSISFSMLMDSEELTKLQKWKEKRSLFKSASGNLHIQSKSFDQENGWVNIGLLRINKKSFMDDLQPVFIKDDLFEGIYITLTKYATGLAFVTFYIRLKAAVTKEVSNVSVPKLKYHVQLAHLNVYSRKSLVLLMKDYWHHSEDILMSNVNSIQKCALHLLKQLMKEIKVKKDDHELCCIYDVAIEQNTPYFDGNPRSLRRHNVLLSRHKKFINTEFSQDEFKSFIGRHHHKIMGVDWVYLKVEPREIGVSKKGGIKEYLSNSGTHLSVAPFLIMNSKINKASNYLNNLKLHNKKQPLEAMHKHLYTISYELKMTAAWLLSAKETMKFHVPSEYVEITAKIIDYNINRVDKLNGVVNDIYSLSENRIQIKNIAYNKRYTALVFVLIVIQIILAAMTIDINKTDAWYYFMVDFVRNYLKES